MKLEFSRQIFEKSKISNFMKIRPVRTELFHADGQMDRHDETNVAFRNFVQARKKVKFALQPDMMAGVGGVQAKLYSIFNLVASFGGWLTERLGCFAPRNDPVPIV